MSESQPEQPGHDVEDDLQKALAAFGDDALDLLADDDDEFELEELEAEASTATQAADERRDEADAVEALLDRYGSMIEEDSSLAYAGTIAMACYQAADAPPRTHSRFVIFAIGHRHFGLPLESVAEIARCEQITALPRTANWLRGVTSLRGKIHSVTDLGRLLQLPGETEARVNKIIVIRSEQHNCSTAVMADRLLGIRELEGSEEGLPDLDHRTATLSTGVARSDEAEIVLIDPDRLLGCSELMTYTN